jgi:hypothetical protein
MAWALLGSINASAVSTSPAVTGPLNCVGADIIIIAAQAYQSSLFTVFPTDSSGNTWIHAVTDDSTNPAAAIFCTSGTAIVSATQVFTLNGPNYPAIEVMAWSGSYAGIDIDQVSHANSANAAVNSITCPSVTPTYNGELVIVSAGFLSAAFTIAPTMTPVYTWASYLIQGTASAISPVLTYNSGGTNQAAICQATFRPAAAPSSAVLSQGVRGWSWPVA